MDFSRIDLNGLTANDFLGNPEQSKFIGLLNGKMSYYNVLDVMERTFKRPAIGTTVAGSILLKCGLTQIAPEDWPNLVKELVRRNIEPNS